MGSQFPKKDSIPEASGPSKFWMFLSPRLPPPTPTISLKSFPTSISHICLTPLEMSALRSKKKGLSRNWLHRGLGKAEGPFGPQSPLPGLAMFTDAHWPWRGSGERNRGSYTASLWGGDTQACGEAGPPDWHQQRALWAWLSWSRLLVTTCAAKSQSLAGRGLGAVGTCVQAQRQGREQEVVGGFSPAPKPGE